MGSECCLPHLSPWWKFVRCVSKRLYLKNYGCEYNSNGGIQIGLEIWPEGWFNRHSLISPVASLCH